MKDYTIHLGHDDNGWTGRVFEEGTDHHIHSTEGANLEVVLAEAKRAILEAPQLREVS